MPAILRVAEFADVIAKAGLVVDNVGVVGAGTGERLQRLMGQYTEAVAAFALELVW